MVLFARLENNLAPMVTDFEIHMHIYSCLHICGITSTSQIA